MRVLILKPGCGIVPGGMKFGDGKKVFSISSIVKSTNGTALVPLINFSDQDTEVEIPPLKLTHWDPEWDSKKNEVQECAN